jgi:thiol-disulfide isomerase/thioredoxin
VLLLIAVFGQAFIKRTRWLANPNGAFRRILGVVFVIVGVLIAFGIDKQVENSLIARGLGVTQIEQRLVETIHTGLAGNDLLDIDTSNAGSNTGAEMNVRTPIQAPELQGIASWINGDPLRLAELKGKVVLIDFWTYSCINCIRTLPHLEAWYKAYAADGLVIIGVHSPEFSFEHELANVQNFVSENDITYPVALDNTFTTWRAYNNRYWPASYFIDREGKIRHTHFGEGDYEENEKVIRALLAEGGNAVNGAMTDIPEETSYVQSQTPETYLGYERATRFANSSEAVDDTDHTYTLHDSLQQNEWSIGGTWNMSGEKLTAVSDAVLRLRFTAKNVYLVMGSHDIATLDVTVDGVTQDTVTIQDATLYPVVSGDTVRSGSLLELHIPAGAELNAFTFGS